MKPRKLRRAIAVLLSVAQIVTLLVIAGPVFTPLPAWAAGLCASPGRDDPAPNGGIVNDYYPAPSTTTTVAAGATSIPVGTKDPLGYGATIASGDLLLIIQMQDATITTTNSSAYGGSGGGAGYTALNSTGLYEYLVATGPVAGGAIPVKGNNAGGLVNAYHSAPGPGQKTYQVLRVPQFSTIPTNAAYNAVFWNGQDGGVAAIDVIKSVSNMSVDVSGRGFRGGGVNVVTGQSTPPPVANTDYVNLSTVKAHGSKGEGVAGTPNYLYDGTKWSTSASPEGYTGGSMAKGAPGNAGGGATENDPKLNDQSSGGAGGGNGGPGGKGGYNYTGPATTPVPSPTPNATINAIGGAKIIPAVSLAVMGGGGGAGGNNTGLGTKDLNQHVVSSSGAAGGGVILLRTNGVGANVTLTANGGNAVDAPQDGGGGGGAGGTIVFTAPSTATVSGVTASANGGSGARAAPTAAPGQARVIGPGGGGGGGSILTSAAVTTSVTGGAAGTTTTAASTYGATAGTAGTTTTISAVSIVGASSGAECPVTLMNGPVDLGVGLGPNGGGSASGGTPYFGANETGSFDGATQSSNLADFTAVSIPLSSPSPAPNIDSTKLPTIVGTNVTVASAPVINVPNMLYYNNTSGSGVNLTLTGTAPINTGAWTMKICPDTSGITTTPSTPNCAAITTNTCANHPAASVWVTVPASGGATTTSTLCTKNATVATTVYWAVYTAPTLLQSFGRYDATVNVADPNTSSNLTHNELYAGYVPLVKKETVLSTPAAANCPSYVTPGTNGICSGAVIRYDITYQNIMLGGGIGSEASNKSAVVYTKPGQLAIDDDGTISALSSTTLANWAAFSNGLKSDLAAGISISPNTCGLAGGPCGDTTTGSTLQFLANHAACTPTGSGTCATHFKVTIGGAAFSLYPPGFPGQTSSGTITFSVVAK